MSEPSEPSTRIETIGRYANVFHVGFNAFELVIEFGEHFSDRDAANAHTRIVTNPVFAQALVESLNEALDKHAGEFLKPRE